MDKKKVIRFVVITLCIAWAIQIAASIFMLNNPGTVGTTVFQVALAGCMYIPLLAALIVKGDFRSMGWKPKFKGNIGYLFFAAYVTVPLTAIGAAIFFMIYPDLFDMSGSWLMAQLEAQGLDPDTFFEQSGITDIKTYMLISIPGAVTAPFINMIFAIGEEAGWRGFLYPELNKKFSRAVTWIIGGTIWSSFHFPAMLIGGYEYGLEYIGSPWAGLIVFTIFCITGGTITEIIYSRTKCIWYAALFHGSINAMATYPQMFMNVNDPALTKNLILGPMPNGMIAMIPWIICAVIMGIMEVKGKMNKKEA